VFGYRLHVTAGGAPVEPVAAGGAPEGLATLGGDEDGNEGAATAGGAAGPLQLPADAVRLLPLAAALVDVDADEEYEEVVGDEEGDEEDEAALLGRALAAGSRLAPALRRVASGRVTRRAVRRAGAGFGWVARGLSATQCAGGRLPLPSLPTTAASPCCMG
jgi:hypothetical protein